MIRLGRVALRVAPRAARARALAPSRRAFSADANDGGNANATAERGAARAALAAAAAQQAAFVSEADQLTSGASQANLQRVLNQKMAACKDASELVELLRTAEKCGWKSNFLTYLAAVEHAASLDAMETVEALLERMQERSLRRDTSLYNVLMRGYARRGDVSAVFDARKRMLADSCVPDAASYGALLHALGRADRHDEALEAIGEMRDAGLRAAAARAGPWNALMAGHAAHDRLERIIDTFGEMARAGVAPDAHSYAVRVSVNIRRRYFDRALALLNTMWELGLARPPRLYHELLEAIGAHPLAADPLTITEVLKLAERESTLQAEKAGGATATAAATTTKTNTTTTTTTNDNKKSESEDKK